MFFTLSPKHVISFWIKCWKQCTTILHKTVLLYSNFCYFANCFKTLAMHQPSPSSNLHICMHLSVTLWKLQGHLTPSFFVDCVLIAIVSYVIGGVSGDSDYCCLDSASVGSCSSFPSESKVTHTKRDPRN